MGYQDDAETLSVSNSDIASPMTPSRAGGIHTSISKQVRSALAQYAETLKNVRHSRIEQSVLHSTGTSDMAGGSVVGPTQSKIHLQKTHVKPSRQQKFMPQCEPKCSCGCTSVKTLQCEECKHPETICSECYRRRSLCGCDRRDEYQRTLPTAEQTNIAIARRLRARCPCEPSQIGRQKSIICDRCNQFWVKCKGCSGQLTPCGCTEEAPSLNIESDAALTPQNRTNCTPKAFVNPISSPRVLACHPTVVYIQEPVLEQPNNTGALLENQIKMNEQIQSLQHLFDSLLTVVSPQKDDMQSLLGEIRRTIIHHRHQNSKRTRDRDIMKSKEVKTLTHEKRRIIWKGLERISREIHGKSRGCNYHMEERT